MSVAVGQKYGNGGVTFTVVAVDKKFVYVKRSDAGKKELASKDGAHAIPRTDFAGWTPA